MRFPVGPPPNGACGDKNIIGLAFIDRDGEYVKELPERGKDGKEAAGIFSQTLCARDYAVAEKKGALMARIVEPKLLDGMSCQAVPVKSGPAIGRDVPSAPPAKRP